MGMEPEGVHVCKDGQIALYDDQMPSAMPMYGSRSEAGLPSLSKIRKRRITGWRA